MCPTSPCSATRRCAARFRRARSSRWRGTAPNQSGEGRGGEEGRTPGGADHLKKKKKTATTAVVAATTVGLGPRSHGLQVAFGLGLCSAYVASYVSSPAAYFHSVCVVISEYPRTL